MEGEGLVRLLLDIVHPPSLSVYFKEKTTELSTRDSLNADMSVVCQVCA